MSLPTTYRGHALTLVYGGFRQAAAATLDAFPLDEEWAQQAAFREIGGPLTPASARVVVPLYPPRDWLSDEAADQAPNVVTYYPTGRVAGLVAPAGRCLLDGSSPGECWTIPRPADGRGSTIDGDPAEEYWMARGAGQMYLADGSVIAAAPLAGEGGHASQFLTHRAAGDHYANTERQVAIGRYVWSDTAGDGVGGIVFVGALAPTVTEERLITARASANSIDFRWITDESRYSLIGCCNVNIGGLPSKWRAAIAAGATVASFQFDPPLDDQLDHKEAADMGDTHIHNQPCSCQTGAKLAAYRLVDGPGTPYGAEVMLPDGRSAQLDSTVKGLDGTDVYLVLPVEDGKLADWEHRVAVPAADVVLTGKRFEWEDVNDSYDAVLAAASAATGTPVAVLRRAALAAPGDPMAAGDPAVMSKLDDMSGMLEEVLAKVTDIHGATIDQALANQGPLPALPG